MNFTNSIPEYLLTNPGLLQIYCFFLRLAKPEPSKTIVNGNVTSLKRYEICVTKEGITGLLKISQDEVDNRLIKLGELDLISHERESNTIRVRFKKLILPSDVIDQEYDEITEYDDYWFDEFIIDYLKYVETNLHKKSLDNSRRVMKLFGAFIGKKKIRDLVPADLEGYKEARKNQPKKISPATINMDIKTIKTALKLAVNWGRIKESPFKSVRLIRYPKKRVPSFSTEEFNLLISHIEEEWLLDIVKFAVLSGLRLGEIMDLRWGNVNLDKNQIVIESSEEYQVKGGKIRTLPLNTEAMKILIKQGQTSDWVFTRNGKKFYGAYVSKIFKKYLRICNLREELHFHCLRATTATWALTAGTPIVAVRDMLGHSSVKTTEHYASYEMENLRDEVQKISLPTKKGKEKNRTPLKLVCLKTEQRQ